MKNVFLKNLGKLLIVITLFTSCSPEDGKDGEQGPAGTANVMYSDWMNQNWNLIDNPTSKSMVVVENRITNDFVSNGGFVLGFFKTYGNTINSLPYQNNIEKNERGFIFGINSTAGTGESGVYFTIQSTDGTTLTSSEVNGSTPNYNPQYRYILIPGGVNISAKSSNDYTKMSYQEICKHFNIPE